MSLTVVAPAYSEMIIASSPSSRRTPFGTSTGMNVPCWLSVLAPKALANTNFTSTRHLEEVIDLWASHWNDDPQPFVWTYSSPPSGGFLS
jgi:hypothetical protein